MLAKETATFTTTIRTVTGFSVRVKRKFFGFERKVAAGTVIMALTAVGQALSLDNIGNLLKSIGSNNYLHPTQVMLDGWKKNDPPTMKKLSIKVNIPEYLIQMAMDTNAGESQKAIADLTIIARMYA